MNRSTKARDTLAVTAALDRSEPLAQMLALLRRSRMLFDDIDSLLPETLRADVRPGSLDGAQWTLLASHGAAAAKLRQLLPQLLHCLQGRGREVTSIRVRVQPRGEPHS